MTRSWRRRFYWFLAVLCAAGWPAVSQTSDAEFESRVRAYLLSHPEIIVDALKVLSERERKAEVRAKLEAYEHVFEAEPALGFGDDAAPIRVVEFFDYKCAPCKAMHGALKKGIASNTELRIEMMHLPILSPGSERAARFALAVKEVAGRAIYRQVHDRLWELNGPLRGAVLEKLANEMGLEWDVIEPVMHSPVVSDQINANRDMAIELGIQGTPAFLTPSSINVGQQDVKGLIAGWVSQ